jgi:hypothetical protein
MTLREIDVGPGAASLSGNERSRTTLDERSRQKGKGVDADEFFEA